MTPSSAVKRHRVIVLTGAKVRSSTPGWSTLGGFFPGRQTKFEAHYMPEVSFIRKTECKKVGVGFLFGVDSKSGRACWMRRWHDDTPLHHICHAQKSFGNFKSMIRALDEIKAIGKISGPTAMTGLLLYSRAMISMLFLGYLGELELAGGSLSIGFANITGYSVISGLAMGMEPICGQAYGAKQMKLLGITLQRTVLLLLSTSIPISFMWFNMKTILLWCGQDEEISSAAHTFIIFAIPDLFLLSLLHPLRVYLRAQNIILPLTYCSAVSVLLHVPLNFLLVGYFKMGISGVAIAMVLTNLNLLILLFTFVYFSGVYRDSWVAPSSDCLRGWSSLLALAIPTCVSVCLEWWWYELMIMMCGLLVNPKATVASMGILIQTTSLVYVFPSALSVGVSTRVGNELGANRPAKARISMIVSLLCAMVLGLMAMAFTTLMRHKWGRFFTNDSEILELTSIALPIVGLCELGNCPQTTGCGVLRGSARPTIGANINLGSFYLVGMPVAIIMGFVLKMGFPGLWLGLLAAQGSCALFMLYVLCKTDWIVQVERAKELTKSPSSSSSSKISKTVINPVLPVSIIKNPTKNSMEANLEEIMVWDLLRTHIFPRTPKPLTFLKNQLREAKNRSNTSPVAKKKFPKKQTPIKNFRYLSVFETKQKNVYMCNFFWKKKVVKFFFAIGLVFERFLASRSRFFEKVSEPENSQTLTFSKNRLRGAKNRSNTSTVTKNIFRKKRLFFFKNFAYVKKKIAHMHILSFCFKNAQIPEMFLKFFYRSFYNTYLKANYNDYKRFEGSRSQFFERNNDLENIGNWRSSRVLGNI
ncbi:hypothetical protein LXL04_030246 [Taraxacum kok-saghyz]